MLTRTPSTITAAATEAATAKQRRALRKLLRDLVAFTGTAINDLAAIPRKTPQSKRARLLYRRADTLSDRDIDELVVAIGAARLMQALDRWSAPSMFSVAAE
jgi:hypothetical protein